MVLVLTELLVVGGVLLAWSMYLRTRVPVVAPAGSVLTRAARRDLYQDAINESLFMRPGQYLTRFLVFFDNRVVDGAVNGLAAVLGGTSGRFRRLQTGFVRSYALSMLAGAAVLVGAMLLVRTDVNDFPWLTTLGAIPLVGSVVVVALPKGRELLAKQVALAVSILALGVTLAMALQFDPDAKEMFQFAQVHEWIPQFGVSYAVGVDGIALVLIALATVLTPVCILASWHDVDDSSQAASRATSLCCCCSRPS